MDEQYNPKIYLMSDPSGLHKDSIAYADYAAIEERILAHMATERPKNFTGELVYDAMEDRVRWRIEKLLTPYVSSRSSGPRHYRLWRDNEPATGGQWHHNIPSAIRRIDYEMAGSWARKVGVLEGQVGSLERRLHEAQEENENLKKLLKSGRSGGAKPNWSPGLSDKETLGRLAVATIDTPSHSEKIRIYGHTIAEAEAVRDGILEARQAIEAFVAAWDAHGVGLHSIRSTERWLNSSEMKEAVGDLKKIAGDVPLGYVTLRQALRTALGHVEHMAQWILVQNRKIGPGTYSFESLGEDLDTLRRLAGAPPNPDRA